MTENSQSASFPLAQAPTALVVDDDELTQELLREMLHDLGCEAVHTALDGRQALKMLSECRTLPSLLLCDIYMPEMDGFEFLERLTALGFAGGLVLMTGGDPAMLSVAKDIAASKRMNVVGTFLKPVSVQQLATVLAAIPAVTEAR
ncbi:response regulator [Curvibacter sp. APW13]|uniref:response regulator n=1 Tax=Curvibacter sp. APW13 TaxID=3077236 RepID=UPI0028DE9301|nr:response regulator [Curvibacter sp. APW13]MDT8990702.1 response regulator [Curvibacter sp. APW13]